MVCFVGYDWSNNTTSFLSLIFSEAKVFKKYNVRVLGTPISVIMATEDRDAFAQKLREIDEKLAQSVCASTVDEGLAAAAKARGL